MAPTNGEQGPKSMLCSFCEQYPIQYKCKENGHTLCEQCSTSIKDGSKVCGLCGDKDLQNHNSFEIYESERFSRIAESIVQSLSGSPDLHMDSDLASTSGVSPQVLTAEGIQEVLPRGFTGRSSSSSRQNSGSSDNSSLISSGRPPSIQNLWPTEYSLAGTSSWQSHQNRLSNGFSSNTWPSPGPIVPENAGSAQASAIESLYAMAPDPLRRSIGGESSVGWERAQNRPDRYYSRTCNMPNGVASGNTPSTQTSPWDPNIPGRSTQRNSNYSFASNRRNSIVSSVGSVPRCSSSQPGAPSHQNGRPGQSFPMYRANKALSPEFNNQASSLNGASPTHLPRPLLGSNNDRALLCIEHNMQCYIFCSTCNKMLCSQCASGSHSGHTFYNINRGSAYESQQNGHRQSSSSASENNMPLQLFAPGLGQSSPTSNANRASNQEFQMQGPYGSAMLPSNSPHLLYEVSNGRANLCQDHNLNCDRFCTTCYKVFCPKCKHVRHPRHAVLNIENIARECHASAPNLYAQCHNGLAQMIKNAATSVSSMNQQLTVNEEAAIQEIVRYRDSFVRDVTDEANFLTRSVSQIAEAKRNHNTAHLQEVNTIARNIRSACQQFHRATTSNSNAQVVLAYRDIYSECQAIDCLPALHLPRENADVGIRFQPAENLRGMRRFAEIRGNAFGPNSFVCSEVVDIVTVGASTSFIVQAVNHINNEINTGGDWLRVRLFDPDGNAHDNNGIINHNNGTYSIVYTPRTRGSYQIHVSFSRAPIINSPFSVTAIDHRDFSTTYGNPVPTTLQDGAGSVGCNDKDLCRPWGICIGYRGRIIVGDRSNNRIKIHDRNGIFIEAFGTYGNGNGQFNRPAGVASDKYGKIIVADKDNHRVQVFDRNYRFLVKFGEYGSEKGKFNYPWGVAVNWSGQILVADSRNHRIQLFSSEGRFLNLFGSEEGIRYLDSPRDVAFTPEQNIVVTDFNKHRILVVSRDMTESHFIGSEGTENGLFQRPQGITVDPVGRIIVADGKNHRIQVLDKSGQYLCKFGGSERGSDIGELDRPSGICYSRDNRILVVDFGNSRVQIF